MTPTDVAVKSTTTRRRAWLRRLLVLPVALLAVAAFAAPALAATNEGLSTYKHEETAKQETAPEKAKKPAAKEEPEHTTTTPTPTTTPAPAKESTLPFTGFDLRWSVGFGLLLMGAGFSIVAVQRRQRRSGGR
jgi:hypothetical protein